MDIQGDITRMNQILKTSRKKTPLHIKGFLIPEHLEDEFFSLLYNFIELAPYYDKYNKYVWDTVKRSQEATNNFIASLCKGISDRTIIFNKEKNKKLEM